MKKHVLGYEDGVKYFQTKMIDQTSLGLTYKHVIHYMFKLLWDTIQTRNLGVYCFLHLNLQLSGVLPLASSFTSVILM